MGSQNFSKEHIDPEFAIRKPGKKFFIVGKVFKVLWPELLGQDNGTTTITADSRFGERLMTKVRWFVIVKEGRNFCTCL
jgi:hypothetical protein